VKKILRTFLELASTQNSFDYELNLELNKKDFPIINHKEGDYMDTFNIIEDSFMPEMVESMFDVNNNIIMACPNGYRYLRRNKFGKIDILTDRKLDVSNCEIINECGVLNFRPKVKILVPKGVGLKFEAPFESSYHYHLYSDCDVTARYSVNKEIPDYHLYTNLRFSVYIDLKRLRRIKNVMTIVFGEPIVTMNFYPMYFIGNTEFAHIGDTYWVRNDEFVKNFEYTY